jgi:16S rRNA (adenine1518-N6/adenine1519-N6)-dimethyltransferase
MAEKNRTQASSCFFATPWHAVHDMQRLRAKKSLGQHFLRSTQAVNAIIDAAVLSTQDTVLEIGPGEGVLTARLLAKAGRVIAVETDLRAISILSERFKDEIKKGTLLLLHGDIRDTPTQERLFAPDALGAHSYKLVANIPYYITGMLFRLFLEKARQPECIVFLVQKEVADEIVARDGKEGLLSLSVKAYGAPRIVTRVKREAFTPPPKVDSAVIAITDISRARLGTLSDTDYFRVVKAGLAARRKMLLGNLAVGLLLPREHLLALFRKLKIPEGVRGEDLPSKTWIMITKTLFEDK